MTGPREDTPEEEAPRCVLVGVELAGAQRNEHRADLDELARLAKTLGLLVIGRVTQRRSRLRPGTVLGLGKLQELARWTGGDGDASPTFLAKRRAESRRELRDGDPAFDPSEDGQDGDEDELDHETTADDSTALEAISEGLATVVVVDHPLTPRMQRNLERATGAQVLDRNQVIVEIFHRHAQSREARLQVEIARLTYVAPRLREAGAGADRQRGGIGGKGAGESSVELDRRKIRDRIAELKRELADVERDSATRRAARSAGRRVALVGYTNAGKSSMMRALTESGIYVADKLFATLDTTVRALRPEVEPRILISDTVGFIKKLPHELVASFRSTLDEALEASLLLFVVDGSDTTFRQQLAVSREVLSEIGAGDVPSIILLNKSDRWDDELRRTLAVEFPDAMVVSAKEPDDIQRVRSAIIAFFDGETVDDEIFVPYARHGNVRHAYVAGFVVSERHDEAGTYLTVRAPSDALRRLRENLLD